jgi:transcription-repair coupling factor (superfamily II helicase)
MELSELVIKYGDHPGLEKIKEIINSPETQSIQLEGLRGAQDCYVLASAFKEISQVQLYIAIDKIEAGNILSTLENILPPQRALFFPDSFRNPGNIERIDSFNVQQRSEVADRLSNRKRQIIVTYPEALFEQVPDPGKFRDMRLSVKKGEKVDMDTMLELAVEYGFVREDFVYEPGQFSVRGGIIDIFSFGSSWPYRIELFDEEVESIRMFNPLTQLSVKNLSEFNLYPNVGTVSDETKKVSLISLLPKKSLIWIKDQSVLTGQLDLFQANFDSYMETADTHVKENEFFQLFSYDTSENLINYLKKFNRIYPGSISEKHEPDHSIKFNSSVQPSFNKQFDLLIKDFNERTKAGYTNYIFTGNKRQIERFYSIFEDLKAGVQFTPVYHDIYAGYIDHDLKLVCYSDHQIFRRVYHHRIRKGFSNDQAVSLKMLRELQVGDYVTHIDHGIGKYNGLEKIEIGGHRQESIRLLYKNNDVLYVSINNLHKISKYTGKEGTIPKISRLGSDAWKKLKQRTKKKIRDIARDLINLYAKRKASKGFAFPRDGYLQNELEASFFYEDTPDQLTVTEEVKADMIKEQSMDRLVCGDVGFGKTEIAIRAAFKAVTGGKQVAILVPTTILALQHHRTFSERMEEFGIKIDYLNRFRSTAERKKVFSGLSDGSIEIVIGTHGLLNKNIAFKNLGLLIIDEEQKFGVASKEKLRNLKVNVDTLTLTATPIPRTLQFSLLGARDLSLLRTPPPDRLPIHTEIVRFDTEKIKAAIEREIVRNGQVFYVFNRVKKLPEILYMLENLCPDISFAMAHGQMQTTQLETTLINFIDHKFDVLVCTNIIETGLDIPNANTMIIQDAHLFGMSDLYQLRGRVGRSDRKAYCYLMSPPINLLTMEARKRLQAMEEFSELGSGFQIAMRDLDIRGAGNLLGAEQSGFITDIGYETYMKILDETLQELKEQEFQELFSGEADEEIQYAREVTLDIDMEMLIPDNYINNIQERLNTYKELDDIKSEEEIEKIVAKLEDRFGKIPWQVIALLNGLRIRMICKQLGFERFIYKNRKLRLYFISDQSSKYFETKIFTDILAYLNNSVEGKNYTLKQTPKYLLVARDDVKSLKACLRALEEMLNQINLV